MCDSSEEKAVTTKRFESVVGNVEAILHTGKNKDEIIEWLSSRGVSVSYNGVSTIIFQDKETLYAVPIRTYVVRKEDGSFLSIEAEVFEQLFKPYKGDK